MSTDSIVVPAIVVAEEPPPETPTMFPTAAPGAIQRRGVIAVLVAAVLGTVISLLRTTGTGPLQSIWEEDARNILSDALNQSGLRAIVQPIAGYYVVGPRLLGELATYFPLSWAAAALSVSSALICALLAVQIYVASGAHVRGTLVRLVISAPLLFAPVAENWLSEIYNRPVGLHFFLMYALFWILLWTPAGFWGKAGLVATVTFTAVSSVLIIGYLPLAVARLWKRRDRLSVVILAVLVAGSLLQLSGFFLGDVTGRASEPARLDPLWAVGTYVFWALPSSVLGFRWTESLAGLHERFGATVSDNLVIIALSWLLVIAFVAGAFLAARRGWVRPQWRLAALAAAHSVGLGLMMVVANGAIAQRYLLPVELLLFSAIAVLLIPDAKMNRVRSHSLLAAFAVFIVVVSAFNYRWDNTYRHVAPAWTQQLAEARAMCRKDVALSHVAVRGGPAPFFSYVFIPCHELQQGIVCVPPRCIYLDPPRSAPRQRAWLRE